jgi:DNA-binding NarL/FixJ family response regulator
VLDAKGIWATDTRVIPELAQALASVDGATVAIAFVDRCAAELGQLDAPIARPAINHARGLTERVAGRDRAASAHLRAAADDYHQLSMPYEAALAAEQAARCALTLGDWASAEGTLRAALIGYRDLGADRDAGRAARLARDHNVSVPARHRGGRRSFGNELSPREREVAELVAAGQTNKEIAAELYLSPNTVARHVSAAMRKFDVRSRAALAQRLVMASTASTTKVDQPLA